MMWLWWVVGVAYALLLSALYVPVLRRFEASCAACACDYPFNSFEYGDPAREYPCEHGKFWHKCHDDHHLQTLAVLLGLPIAAIPFLALHRPTRRARELARAKHDLALAKVRDEEDRLLSEQLARLSRERGRS